MVSVRIERQKIIQIFGDPDSKAMKNIRGGNYMAYKTNCLRFNKLVMNDVDPTVIDMDSNDPLDFYLEHYKEQISAEYTKTTPDSGSCVSIKQASSRKSISHRR